MFVVANDPAPWAALAVEVVPDRIAGSRAAGRHPRGAGASDDCDAVVCVAGDLPFVAPALLAALRDRAPGADAVAPRAAGGIEPLCARYARGLLPAVEARVRAGELAVHAMLEGLAVDWIEGAELAALDPDGRSFFNVNTPEDLRRAEELAGRGA